MKKKLEYRESFNKTNDGLLWYKCLEDKEYRGTYREFNTYKEITFSI